MPPRLAVLIINLVWVLHDYKPRMWEVEAGGSGVADQHQLHSEFEASLGYTRPRRT